MPLWRASAMARDWQEIDSLQRHAVTQLLMDKSPAREHPLILLAEDFEDARELYRDYLEFSGFEVKTANNGREAIEQALALQPDVILMDASMPVLDGWQATRELKANPATKHIPILALTAHAFDDARKEA